RGVALLVEVQRGPADMRVLVLEAAALRGADEVVPDLLEGLVEQLGADRGREPGPAGVVEATPNRGAIEVLAGTADGPRLDELDRLLLEQDLHVVADRSQG